MKCIIYCKEIEKSAYSNAPLCSSECFRINFWNEIVAEKNKHIIINGECYYDEGNIDNPNRHSFLGCAGRRFWIRFNDGRTITTNNLWCQGTIPEDFRDKLPDNAEFYTPDHIKFANSLIREV